MISIFGSEPGSPDAQPQAAFQPQPAAQQQAAYPAAQHPAISKTVVTQPGGSTTALAPRFANTHAAAPAPEKHGIFSWLSIGKAKKRLQMLETVSLGEKRFVALVQVDGRQFLIGGAPSNVGMLAELAPEETFQQVLRDATEGLNEVPAALSTQPALTAPAPTAASTHLEVPAPLAPTGSSQMMAVPVVTAPAPAPAPTAPVMAAPPQLETPIPVPIPVAGPVATHAPIQYASIAPLPLAEATPSGPVLVASAPKSAAPSLPPHVAARLAELQAAAQMEQAMPAHATLADDLSLEEPVSFSPSLLAAMQQRARAALLNDQTPIAPAHAQEAATQEILSVTQKVAAVPTSAPSFTFQFSPMLTSTTQAVRMPGSAMKLQGAA